MVSQPTFLLDEMDRHNTRIKKEAAEEFQRSAWRNCWGWEGPKAGEYCEIDSCVVPTEHGGTVYAYMEQVRLIDERADGTWLAEIEMGVANWWDSKTPFKWPHDGTRVILRICDIWPHVRELRKKRADLARVAEQPPTPHYMQE